MGFIGFLLILGVIWFFFQDRDSAPEKTKTSVAPFLLAGLIGWLIGNWNKD